MGPSDGGEDDLLDGESAYEALRRRNIERNRSILLDLGFRGKAPAATTRKRPRTEKKPKQPKEPERRSTRNRGAHVDYSEKKVDLPRRLAVASGPQKEPAEANDEDVVQARPTKSRKASSGAGGEARPPAAPDSTRSLHCDTEKLMRDWVGVKLEATGKQAVVDLATLPGPKPRFSRYSGVTEWRNAVFLWVNVGGSDYDNLFTGDLPTEPAAKGGAEGSAEDGADTATAATGSIGSGGSGRSGVSSDKAASREIAMTWFAGSRQTEETPVILRLLPPALAVAGEGVVADAASKLRGGTPTAEPAIAPVAGEAAAQVLPDVDSAPAVAATVAPAAEGAVDMAAADSDPVPDILLFCRLPGEPYVFCGRLDYRSHVPESQPLRFVWVLRDAEALRASAAFCELVNTAEE